MTDISPEEKREPLDGGNSKKIKESRRVPEKKADNSLLTKAGDFSNSLIDNVIVPAAQDTLIDIVQSILNGIMNGIVGAITGQPVEGNRVSVPVRRNSRNGRTDYNSIYRSGSSRNVSSRDRDRVPESTRLRDLKVNNHADAVSVIEQLYQLLEQYHRVTCNDLYGLPEIDKSCPYTYTNYGWTDLGDAGIINNGDGTWSFDLPRPIHLD